MDKDKKGGLQNAFWRVSNKWHLLFNYRQKQADCIIIGKIVCGTYYECYDSSIIMKLEKNHWYTQFHCNSFNVDHLKFIL